MEEKDHVTDCYFYMINLKVINCKNKNHVQYPNVLSTIRPIPYGLDLPALEPDGNMVYSLYSEPSDMTVVAGDDAYKPVKDNQPVSLIQTKFNHLT